LRNFDAALCGKMRLDNYREMDYELLALWGPVDMEERFHRNPDVEVAPLRSEIVLFNPQNNKFCVLNKSASVLWDSLKEPRTVGELASDLCHCFDVGEDSALHDAQAAVQQLLAAELIRSHSQINLSD
jgi:hypothetical protein